ncbi:syncoilin [Megalops cyprinoides]|uniref:syncoilin n=1 Tax=Megalops cyprinoides TaxID=118141 RepID=UPI00186436D9|nr:syncoilin [Megalops cyprinoides]
MDDTAARLREDPAGETLLPEAGVQFEGGDMEELEFFEDCVEEFRAQFEECMDRLGAQFRGRLEEMGEEFEDCVEEVGTQPKGSVDELAAQIEECIEELGIQLRGYGDTRPLFEGRIGETGTQASGSVEDIWAGSGCADMPGPQLDSYVEDIEARLKGCVEEVRQHCEVGVQELGVQFAGCIEEVAGLELRRDELVQELLQLEAPMAEAVQALRAELGETRRQLTRAELERRSLQEERLSVKRQLFVTVRDCTESRVALETQQRELEQFAVVQGELQAQVQQLTEEVAQLREAQQNRLNALRGRMDSLGEERAQGDLSTYRQASWDIRAYLQDGIKALEDQYEPRLEALRKRKQAAADALLETRAQAQDLRARLGPLREEAQRLGLQRTCLEEKIALKQRERSETVGQYRETLDTLEESSRQLKTELQLQRKKTEEMKTLNGSLLKELELYRGCADLHGKLTPTTEGI